MLEMMENLAIYFTSSFKSYLLWALKCILFHLSIFGEISDRCIRPYADTLMSPFGLSGLGLESPISHKLQLMN